MQIEDPASPPIPQAESDSHYDFNSQEVEHKGTADLSAKKVQKLNKELVKQNTHLVRSMDLLKKEKELLVNEKVKLKSSNRTLEKELKKVSSRGEIQRLASQQSTEEISCDVDELNKKVKLLEDLLAERDYKVAMLRMRLEKTHLELTDSSDTEGTKLFNSTWSKNGAIIMNSTPTLDKLLGDQDVSLKLKKENEELKMRLLTLESELDRVQLDLSDPSPKSPRKRPSGFFKRGKKGTSSRQAVEDTLQQEHLAASGRGEFSRSESPDISQSQHENRDISPSLLQGQKASSSSLPSYDSPHHLSAEKQAQKDISTLQSCLKVAIDEKNKSEAIRACLDGQLTDARCKIRELEELITVLDDNAKTETEENRLSLKKAETDRDTYFSELKLVREEMERKIREHAEKDDIYTESLGQKEKKIKELEKQIEMLKDVNLPSPPYNKPPLYRATTSPKKQASSNLCREKLFNYSSSPKDTSSDETASSLSVDKNDSSECISSEKNAETSLKNDRPHRLSSIGSSGEKTVKAVKAEWPPRKVDLLSQESNKASKSKEVQKKYSSSNSPTPTKKVGRFSQESSIGTFESPPKEIHGKNSSSNLPEPPVATKKVGRLSLESSIDIFESLSKDVQRKNSSSNLPDPPSPTKKVGRLSRESSIDIFEPKEVQRKNSISKTTTPSSAHTAKVAATRAMFEQKIDQSKTETLPFVKRSSKPSVFEKKRSNSCSSYTAITTTTSSSTNDTQNQHSKSYSYDYSTQHSCSQQLPKSMTVPSIPVPVDGKPQSPTVTAEQSKKPVSPTPIVVQSNGPNKKPNDARNSITITNSTQQGKGSSMVKTPSIVAIKSSENGTKVSRVTITKTTSPSGSPLPTKRKEIAVKSPKRDQSPSGVMIRNPSLISNSTNYKHTSNTSRVLQGQQNTSQRVTTVSTTVKHSAPSKVQSAVEINNQQKAHSPVTKSQTELRIHHPVDSVNQPGSMWSFLHQPPQSTNSTSSFSKSNTKSSSQPNKVVVNSTSKLGGNLFGSVTKVSSLQDIPAQVTSSSENNTPPPSEKGSSSKMSASTATTSVGIRRGPTHKALQRRERKERPQTMYAGRAETANLVNLITKFQEVEKEKKLRELKTTTATSSRSVPSAVSPTKVNGTSSPVSAPPASDDTVLPIHTQRQNTGIYRQQNTGTNRQQSRPTSYYSTSRYQH